MGAGIPRSFLVHNSPVIENKIRFLRLTNGLNLDSNAN